MLLKGRVERWVAVPSARAAAALVDAISAELATLLERRFDGVDRVVVADVCDAAISPMLVIDAYAEPGVRGDAKLASLRFAEATYTSIRAAHSDNERLTAEWGFSGFCDWFAATAARLLASA